MFVGSEENGGITETGARLGKRQSAFYRGIGSSQGEDGGQNESDDIGFGLKTGEGSAENSTSSAGNHRFSRELSFRCVC